MELLLIRWIGSEIRVFAYFKSLVLIACFLGFGLGCYLTRRTIYLLQTLAPVVAMVILVELPWKPLRHLIANLSNFIGWLSDIHMWSRAYFAGNAAWALVSAAAALVIVISLFGLVAVCFVPLGQLVGWHLENAPKGIHAYSINVAASIVGIWFYTLLCFRSTEPIVWFALLGLGLLACFRAFPRPRIAVAATFAVVLALFAIGSHKAQWWGEESWKGSQAALYKLDPGETKTVWSPYQKLTVVPLLKNGEAVRYVLNTNDSWYQEILDLSDAAVAKNPELYEDGPVRYHRYNLPYRFHGAPPDDVLIAGAGMGNDVAAALRNGARHVTAVEIDPLIYAEGKRLHLEHPYDSPRVEVHVDDARAFVQNTKARFDLVVYSILDSHTTSSYYTNVRLDNYVYTVESMEAAKRLLKPGGLFVMSFSSERPWFAGRLRDVVTQAFGKPPLMVKGPPFFFISGDAGTLGAALASDPGLRSYVETHSNVEIADSTPTTDDWPYLYQQYRGVPKIVWILSAGLILIGWVTFRKVGESWQGIQWHFFFLGAAFMLLEVQIISKVALLFGTTWLVNSIVISTLLAFILLANMVVSVFPSFPQWLAYPGLFAAVAASYFVSANSLFFDSLLLRGAAATALYCSPVFFAGLIFISSFKECGFRAEAFGSNLLGSLVGGLLESMSYAVGIKALVIVAAALYLISMATRGQLRVPVLFRKPALS